MRLAGVAEEIGGCLSSAHRFEATGCFNLTLRQWLLFNEIRKKSRGAKLIVVASALCADFEPQARHYTKNRFNLPASCHG
jgi:hypothetical protein